MKKKVLLISVILILVATISVSVISAKEKTQPINWDLTGSIMNLGDAGSQFDVNLKGAPGVANARGLGFSGPPVEKSDLPEGNVCVDISGPDGVLFLEAQMIVQFDDGSLLFGNAAEGGYVCFVPMKDYPQAHVPYEFAGGTGRFEGATGYVLFEIFAYNFNEEGTQSLVTGETGTGTGEIILP
jgi:hypothetical protein